MYLCAHLPIKSDNIMNIFGETSMWSDTIAAEDNMMEEERMRDKTRCGGGDTTLFCHVYEH